MALLTAGPAAAPGAEPGVIVDPNSPTAKEYAIPLEKARRDTGGPSKSSGRTSNGQAEKPAPFGEGISPDKTETAPAAAATHPRRAKRPVRARRNPVRPVSAPAPPAAAENASLASASAGSGTGWSLGLGLGVLALGAGLGIALRRLARRRAP